MGLLGELGKASGVYAIPVLLGIAVIIIIACFIAELVYTFEKPPTSSWGIFISLLVAGGLGMAAVYLGASKIGKGIDLLNMGSKFVNSQIV